MGILLMEKVGKFELMRMDVEEVVMFCMLEVIKKLLVFNK